jgi:hypothetical protein
MVVISVAAVRATLVVLATETSHICWNSITYLLTNPCLSSASAS